MKIRAHVLEAIDSGEHLKIVAQGSRINSACWRTMNRIEMTIPMSDLANQTYHVGRRFTITLTPEKLK